MITRDRKTIVRSFYRHH